MITGVTVSEYIRRRRLSLATQDLFMGNRVTDVALKKRIFTEWLPSSGYQHACAPELEVYYNGDVKSEDYRCEVWIPIKK